MDANDQDIGFAASLLYYAVDRGGLTEKQAKHGRRLVERVHALWLAETLICQRDRPPSTPAGLHSMSAKGSA